ncbi:DEKNAAC101652 [Brettanomyces naardenensis]|uniref:DEKNAAC101652 n=1 Tax=Brettanomyces naardenensis TaxID=13370 RepID=A0A448YIS4_BRENA|nr:DEKNAAC101652 [Brettanomyces naardenensis]
MHEIFSWIKGVVSPFEYGDPLASEGFWGPPTATLDFCEENYVVSSYAAEIINTLTNLIYVFFAFNLLLSTIRNKHGAIFILASLGLLAVGVGSWLYHMTLRYEFQLLDELPMVYFTWIPFAYVFTIGVENRRTKLIIYGGMTTSLILFTVIYLFVYQNPAFHEIIYAGISLGLVYRTIVLTNWYVTDRKFKRFMFKLLIFSMFEIALAFLVWNLDTIYCSGLIRARRFIGLPLGIFLELHGFWHLFIGIGIHHFILFTQCLNAWYKKQQADYQIEWWLGLPFKVSLMKTKDKSHFGLQEKADEARQ